MPRPGIIQNSCEGVLRIWKRDLQIFSLTLSQLSYLGSDTSIENNVKKKRIVKELMNTNILSTL